jgi:hypothetical protein
MLRCGSNGPLTDRRLADVADDWKARHPINLADAFAASLANRKGHRRPRIQDPGQGNQNQLADIVLALVCSWAPVWRVDNQRRKREI